MGAIKSVVVNLCLYEWGFVNQLDQQEPRAIIFDLA
jgi:hypothetical protein